MIVVIPAYQPDEQLVKLTQELQQRTDYRVVVVNDGSSEERAGIFAALPWNVTVLEHERNRGKGRALKTALQYIADNCPANEQVVLADADGQHAVQDIIAVGEEVKKHPSSLILGVRRLQGEIPWRSRMGNGITRRVFTLFTGQSVSDTQTGLRAFGAGLIPALSAVKGERYEYEMNMLLGCVEQRIPIHEVPITTIYHDKDNSASHFRYFRDSALIYACIVKFAGSSFLSFWVDYAAFLGLLWLTGIMGVSSALVWSNVLARVISASMNYSLNRYYVFHSSDGWLRSLSKYLVLAAGILAVNTVLLKFFTLTLGIPGILSKPIVEILLFSVSLIIQRLFVFPRSHLASSGR
ncbi:MAG: bifunctional glycosyltransferase family 2/GtrA family protein [Syntrophomonadaceae bacterium]|nr:bifunctional glycosyltransferase family 2/GtrA family protein [Syntrophomonadaceae bacterium]